MTDGWDRPVRTNTVEGTHTDSADCFWALDLHLKPETEMLMGSAYSHPCSVPQWNLFRMFFYHKSSSFLKTIIEVLSHHLSGSSPRLNLLE